jgi:hypothetical protein
MVTNLRLTTTLRMCKRRCFRERTVPRKRYSNVFLWSYFGPKVSIKMQSGVERRVLAMESFELPLSHWTNPPVWPTLCIFMETKIAMILRGDTRQTQRERRLIGLLSTKV